MKSRPGLVCGASIRAPFESLPLGRTVLKGSFSIAESKSTFSSQVLFLLFQKPSSFRNQYWIVRDQSGRVQRPGQFGHARLQL
jgi:hypothetical protein